MQQKGQNRHQPKAKAKSAKARCMNKKKAPVVGHTCKYKKLNKKNYGMDIYVTTTANAGNFALEGVQLSNMF